MADKYVEHMYRTIKEDGGWNSGHLWKLRQKLHPRPADPPTAMENQHGVLLTDPLEIQNEALRHYESLFKDLPMSPEYEEVMIEKEKLFEIRLKSTIRQHCRLLPLDGHPTCLCLDVMKFSLFNGGLKFSSEIPPS